MGMFSSLKYDQKEAIALLQVGTFLEYFDLMLYVHMTVLLNELFFPKTEPHTAALLAAFAFCSTFVMRPFGALLFGWIGDNIGRKATVIITTMLMAVSCIVMANLPTYAQVGITASWVVTICRLIQGVSSLGEKVGAEIYLTESIKIPLKYPLVSLITVSSSIGSMTALGVATLFTLSGFDWRIAFWIGALIAIVGTAARTRLRETPDFVDLKRRMKKAIEQAREDGMTKAADLLKKTNPIWKEKCSKKTLFSYFCICCSTPICFFFTYIYCSSILRDVFEYSTSAIIRHNFALSAIDFIGLVFFSVLSYKINPLKILYFRLTVYVPFMFTLPYALTHMQSPVTLFMLQSIMLIFSPTESPATAIFLIHFPIFKRFTGASLMYALSRVFIYILVSFGFVYLTELLNHWGLLVIMIPLAIGFYLGVHHFVKLEELRESMGNNSIAVNRPHLKLQPDAA